MTHPSHRLNWPGLHQHASSIIATFISNELLTFTPLLLLLVHAPAVASGSRCSTPPRLVDENKDVVSSSCATGLGVVLGDLNSEGERCVSAALGVAGGGAQGCDRQGRHDSAAHKASRNQWVPSLQVHKESKNPFMMSGCKVADGSGTMLVI